MIAAAAFELDIGGQDDLRYWWRLSRPSGRVIEQGVEAYIASCLGAAASAVDPDSEISVSVDGNPGGCYAAVRMQLESLDVAAEIARAVLVRPGLGSSPET